MKVYDFCVSVNYAVDSFGYAVRTMTVTANRRTIAEFATSIDIDPDVQNEAVACAISEFISNQEKQR